MSLEISLSSSAQVQSSQSHPDQKSLISTKLTKTKNRMLEAGHSKQINHELQKFINQVNGMVQLHHTALQFVLFDELDQENAQAAGTKNNSLIHKIPSMDYLNEYFVQVVDTENNKVIYQIPPKKFLEQYAERLKYLGLLIDESV